MLFLGRLEMFFFYVLFCFAFFFAMARQHETGPKVNTVKPSVSDSPKMRRVSCFSYGRRRLRESNCSLDLDTSTFWRECINYIQHIIFK